MRTSCSGGMYSRLVVTCLEVIIFPSETLPAESRVNSNLMQALSLSFHWLTKEAEQPGFRGSLSFIPGPTYSFLALCWLSQVVVRKRVVVEMVISRNVFTLKDRLVYGLSGPLETHLTSLQKRPKGQCTFGQTLVGLIAFCAIKTVRTETLTLGTDGFV